MVVEDSVLEVSDEVSVELSVVELSVDSVLVEVSVVSVLVDTSVTVAVEVISEIMIESVVMVSEVIAELVFHKPLEVVTVGETKSLETVEFGKKLLVMDEKVTWPPLEVAFKGRLLLVVVTLMGRIVKLSVADEVVVSLRSVVVSNNEEVLIGADAVLLAETALQTVVT